MSHENPEMQWSLDVFSETDQVEYLLEESDHRADGYGPATNITNNRGTLIVLTLSINQTDGRGNLAVAIWGSRSRADRGFKSLLAFYDKSYCGMYSMPLDLNARPEICYLRVHWKLTRWTREAPPPAFTFSVFMRQVSVGH